MLPGESWDKLEMTQIMAIKPTRCYFASYGDCIDRLVTKGAPSR